LCGSVGLTLRTLVSGIPWVAVPARIKTLPGRLTGPKAPEPSTSWRPPAPSCRRPLPRRRPSPSLSQRIPPPGR